MRDARKALLISGYNALTMSAHFAERLRQLRGVACATVEGIEYEMRPKDDVYAVGTTITFSDGTKLAAQFWRLIKDDKPSVSIFDHRQKYGFPAPIDALQILDRELRGNAITIAEMNRVTGDLRFSFANGAQLEVFNFTAFEIWEITFADGSVELSNYALRD